MTIISGKQSLGQRENQEDAFEIVYQNERDPKSDILMLVADGMGGHAGGEVASNLALTAFKTHFVEGSVAPRPRDRLQDALTTANDALRQRIATQSDLKGMGCTLVAALKLGDRLVWVSVGDSSLFLLRDGRLKRLNADHSLYGELLQMVAAGQITQEEADGNPRRNALRSALMGDQISLTDVNAIGLKPGDVVLACSDGLDTLTQSEITAILQRGKTRDMRGVASDLLNAVEAKGKPKQDNTTVVVYAHVQDGMSSMLRGSQWAFHHGDGNRKTLKYMAIGLGALAIGATVGALSWTRTDTPETTVEQEPERSGTVPQEERSIGDRSLAEEPDETRPDPTDGQVTEPEIQEEQAQPTEPEAPAEETPPSQESEQQGPELPEPVTNETEEPPEAPLEEER
ncbi:PP2C family serine/threonine-protein phosphatase [Ruegeria sp. EL01]|jgi:serine/threonine protein phosphatase PrpC|uniref:PP2C family protein-serine/threonine phosphatase n=1 Tax=Ruegeria sp. EL01 TaxID=2107578 RepID=UPI000EA80749|nr:protein phosphatase 2C domain-containing protein [Ruegeria sp. EL01]